MSYRGRSPPEDSPGFGSVEQIVSQASSLMQDYEERITAKLATADMQLIETGVDLDVKGTVQQHVYAWNGLLIQLQRVTAKMHTEGTSMLLQSESAGQSIRERDELIGTLQQDLSKQRSDYEAQISTLHELLSTAGSKKTPEKATSSMSVMEIEAVKTQLTEQMRQFQRQQMENDKLQSTIRALRGRRDDDELAQELEQIREQLFKKEGELLEMTMTVHSLEKERIESRQELGELRMGGRSIREAVKDADYSMGDTLDRFFSSEVSIETSPLEDTGFGGDEDDISQLLNDKISQALEAASAVAQGKLETAKPKSKMETPPPMASPTPEHAHRGRKLPHMRDMKDESGDELISAFEDLDEFLSLPIPRDMDSLRLQLEYSKHALDDMRSEISDYQLRLKAAEDGFDPARDLFGGSSDETDEEELYAEEALGRKASTHDRFFSTFTQLKGLGGVVEGTMAIQKIGQFDAVIDVGSKEKTYKLVMDQLRMKLKNGQTECSIMEDVVNSVLSDLAEMDADSFEDVSEVIAMVALQRQSVGHLAKSASKLAALVEQVIDELRGAEHFVHSDHKKITNMELQIKELRETMSYVSPRQFAVLRRVPDFIKKQLQEYEDSTLRAKALEDATKGITDKAKIEAVKRSLGVDLDYERQLREEKRIRSFNATLDELENSAEQVLDKIDFSSGALLDAVAQALRGDLRLTESSLDDLIDRLHAAFGGIHAFAKEVGSEFTKSREFVHPTHESLIQATMDNVDKSIEIDGLKREVANLKGQLGAANEELAGKRKEGIIADSKSAVADRRRMGDRLMPATGVAPATGKRMAKRREPSWGFGSMDLNFLDVAEFELKDNSEYGIADEEKGSAEVVSRHLDKAKAFLPKLQAKVGSAIERNTQIETILSETGLSTGRSSLNSSDLSQIASDISNELLILRDTYNEMLAAIQDADGLIGADSRYIARIEGRYQQFRGLYRMKAVEVTNMKDNLMCNEEELAAVREHERELRLRVQQLMTSAAAPSEWRLEMLEERGLPSQGYARVMAFISECVSKTVHMCANIDDYVGKDLPKLVRDSLDGEKRMQLFDLKTQVNSNSEGIRKIISDIKRELVGIETFVHSDRNHISKLEAEVLHLKTRSGMDETQTETRASVAVDKTEEQPTATRQRRHSITAFRCALEDAEEDHLRIEAKDSMTREVRERKRVSKSKRRNSSFSGIDFNELDDEESLMFRRDMRETKSDLGIRDKEDAVFDVSKAAMLRAPFVGRMPAMETPATSPTTSAQKLAVGDHKWEDEEMVEDPLGAVTHDLFVPEQSPAIVQSYAKLLEDRNQLIEDLQGHIEALKATRQTEIRSIQGHLENMRSRCGTWFERLVLRLDDLESDYRAKMSAKADEPSVEEYAEELERVREDAALYMEKMRELEESKNAERRDADKRIRELNDDLDEAENSVTELKKEKRTIMRDLTDERDALAEMEEKLGTSETRLRDARNRLREAEERALDAEAQSPKREESSEAAAEVLRLREALNVQEQEYEDEIRQFEMVANQKLQQLEGYFDQQIEEARQREAELAPRLEEALARASQAEDRLQSMGEEMERLREDRRNSSKVSQLEADVNRLYEENSGLKQSLKAYSERYAQEKERVDSYRKGIEDLGNTLKTVLKDQDSLRAEIGKKTKKLEKAKEKKRKLKDRLKASEKQAENLRGVAKEMLELKRTWKHSAEEWTTKENDMKQETHALELEIVRLKDSKMAQIRQTVAEINNLRGYIRKLQKRIRYLESDSDEVESVAVTSVVGGFMSSFFGGTPAPPPEAH